MDVASKLLKVFAINLAVLIVLLLVVFFPRHIEMVPNGAAIDPHFQFSWTLYRQNLSNFISTLWSHHTLGLTRYDTSAESEIAEYLPRSLLLILVSTVLSISFGIWKGIFDYQHRRGVKSLFGQRTTWLFQSLPDFFVILCLQWVLVLYVPSLHIFGSEHWYSFIIPSLLVSVYPSMYLARMTALALLSQEHEPFLQVAFAKGLSEKAVLYRHLVRSSLGTILNYLPTVMLYILSNLLIVEYLLDYKGAAFRLYVAMDYSNALTGGGTAQHFEGGLVIGLALCFMGIVFLTQVIALVAKKVLDPR